MAKTYVGEPVLAEYKASPDCILYCPTCHQEISNGQVAVGRDVFKCGEFDYTEIVHADCYEGPKALVVSAGDAHQGILIDGKTVQQWLAERGKG